MEFKVNSLEDMCSLMCDNVVPTTQHVYCLRCGRKLKTEESKRIGYGKICEKKAKEEAHFTLF